MQIIVQKQKLCAEALNPLKMSEIKSNPLEMSTTLVDTVKLMNEEPDKISTYCLC